MSVLEQAIPAPPTTADKIRALPWSIAANSANTVFVNFTFFGSAFVLFLNALEINPTQIGFLLALFPFMGIVAPFIAGRVARFGYKRTYVTFWTLRKFVTALLVLVPLVLAHLGLPATVIYITLVTAGFGLCRAIAEVGYYPWVQEFVPDSIRGKYSATNNLFSSIAGVISVTIASFVLDISTGLDRFVILFAAGTAFGLLSVSLVARVPGGAPVRREGASTVSYRDMLEAARDRNLLLYLAGIGLVTLATGPLISFLPLFMREQVGLSEGNIVLLQTAGLIGGLVSTYFLGWSADRYGSKPVMLSGVLLKLLLPIGWFFMPRFSELSLPVALLIAFFQGASGIAWLIGSSRLLFVSVVPTARKTQYMAVYYAAIGLIGGFSQLIGGRVLDLSAGLSGQFLVFTIDPFTPLFLAGLILPAVSLLLFRRVRGDSPVGVVEFAGLFAQGNAFYALESMVRYHRARDERSTVAMTERMGQARSPLTVDEMLEALADPRFNVRFEAIISIARTKPHPRLIEALSNIVSGTELSLSVIAAWALARMGDPSGIPALRAGLDSPYRSIQAHCVRSLGTLKDYESISLLHQRLLAEEDKGLQMAYASALGNLQAGEALETIAGLLRETTNEGARLELALALARMIGEEQHYIRILRQIRQDMGTAISQELMALKNPLSRAKVDDSALSALLAAAEAFAREDMPGGTERLVELIDLLPPELYTGTARELLAECAQQLAQAGEQHIEYVVLALHVLHAGRAGR
jgi:MFS family permease